MKEEELSHKFSKQFERKKNKLIRQENRALFMRGFINYSKRAAVISLIFVSRVFVTTMSVEVYRVKFYEDIIILGDKIMRNKLSIFILLLIYLVLLTSCSLNKGKNSLNNSKGEYELLSDRLQDQIDRKQDDYLNAVSDESLNELIKLDSITYGSFTDIGVSEILGLFKFKDIPHVGGLDRTIAVIYDANTYKLKIQKTFVADNVFIQVLENNDQRHSLLYIGTVTYQGYTSYDAQLLQAKRDQWISKDVSDERFANSDAFFFSDNVLQVFELTYHNYNPIYKYKYPLFWNGAETQFMRELP